MIKQFEEFVNESFGDSIKKLISKFRREQQNDTNSFKTMEDARLEYYQISQNQQNVSVADAMHIIKDIRMKFKDFGYMFGSGDDHTRGFLQGFLYYGYLNFKNLVRQDPFGENACNIAYSHCMKQTNDRGCALSLLGRFFYGWSFAKELDLKLSNKWTVDWNGDVWKPILDR